MARQNYAAQNEHESLVTVIKAFLSDQFVENVANAVQQTPNPDSEQIKLTKEQCVSAFKDRLIADMGFMVNETDKKDTASYAKEALERRELHMPALSISCGTCNKCAHNEFVVTDQCQGCLARPCTNCPFGAIEFINGKSHINKEKCKRCGICAKSCPYGAIIKRTMPCAAVCPVDAVEKTQSGCADINEEKCISCGQCAAACPFGAIMARSEIIDVLKAIKAGKKVIAMPAPAIMGQFGMASIAQILSAFLKAGFTDAIEVAVGADITTRNEAVELAERMENGAPFMTTSCCPAYYNAVRKHIPEMQEFVSHTLTPMQYTARLLKKRDPECVTVFIGPCMAKRVEGFHDEYTDFVLNNKEVEALFEVLNIVPKDLPEEKQDDNASKQGRGFALTGGVAEAVVSLKTCEVCPVAVNGLNKESVRQLKMYAKNRKADGNLVEVMACTGGCVGGPGVAAPIKNAMKEIKDRMAKSEDLKL